MVMFMSNFDHLVQPFCLFDLPPKWLVNLLREGVREMTNIAKLLHIVTKLNSNYGENAYKNNIKSIIYLAPDIVLLVKTRFTLFK